MASFSSKGPYLSWVSNLHRALLSVRLGPWMVICLAVMWTKYDTDSLARLHGKTTPYRIGAKVSDWFTGYNPHAGKLANPISKRNPTGRRFAILARSLQSVVEPTRTLTLACAVLDCGGVFSDDLVNSIRERRSGGHDTRRGGRAYRLALSQLEKAIAQTVTKRMTSNAIPTPARR